MIYLRKKGEELFFVAFCEASCGHYLERGMVFLEMGVRKDSFDGFFFGFVNKTTGIDNDDIRFLGV